MIDDGPAYKLLLYRAVKRFEIDLREWPWPPVNFSDDWDTYWRTRFEDTLFRVGLGVRKLIESAKLSVEAQEHPINVTFLPIRKDYFPGAIDQHHIERFYDDRAERPDQIPLLLLCHAIVHSYVLVPRFNVSTHTGLSLQDFYLASDRGRKKGVYLVDWRTFVNELVYAVASDEVNGLVMHRLPNGEEIRIPTSRPNDLFKTPDRIVDLYRNLSQGHAKSFDKFMKEWREAYDTPLDPESGIQ
ncbi:hypothetical protein [Streptomyces hydrogenans]|uniref:Uncharacterized protein n=1 Tax=Streptomyces hydrogenans TaxID=1873719 RepID=A0ABQ3PMH2_9ACTN|nr:hypothetical protein [Streptomyces hydrogenans]GHE31944.1 hypothetical protein GCM10018784_80610 [Streptomyces hydrogenans]GHI26228.1 hypothetical protein Shyd_75990 [Streptomyces hydrogenans]